MFEYCKLYKNTIYWLAAHGMFADKNDPMGEEAKAWERLSKEGWELVSVVADDKGEFNYFFKRPAQQAAKK